MTVEDENVAADDGRTESDDILLQQVIEELSANPRTLPCKLFYDELGSALFDQICELPEYYPTRTETAIFEQHGEAMARCLGPHALLIELGSGSSVKTRLILDRLVQPAGYVPIEISGEHLKKTVEVLHRDYPDLAIEPICADYTLPVELPDELLATGRPVVFFPGSTIGNFHPDEAVEFLRRLGTLVHAGGGLLIGVDLKKDRAILEAAYDDAAGVTARFNLNMLVHLNRELKTDFNLQTWRHRAKYDERAGRIEMHLVSNCAQSVRVGDRVFRFGQGETIRTEVSYKYAEEEFSALATTAGFRPVQIWTDPDRLFSVHFLEIER